MFAISTAPDAKSGVCDLYVRVREICRSPESLKEWLSLAGHHIIQLTSPGYFIGSDDDYLRLTKKDRAGIRRLNNDDELAQFERDLPSDKIVYVMMGTNLVSFVKQKNLPIAAASDVHGNLEGALSALSKHQRCFSRESSPAFPKSPESAVSTDGSDSEELSSPLSSETRYSPALFSGFFPDVTEVKEAVAKDSKGLMVFLGDYGSRGKKSLEVVVALIQRFIDHPETLLLLQGNHETSRWTFLSDWLSGVCADDPSFARTHAEHILKIFEEDSELKTTLIEIMKNPDFKGIMVEMFPGESSVIAIVFGLMKLLSFLPVANIIISDAAVKLHKPTRILQSHAKPFPLGIYDQEIGESFYRFLLRVYGSSQADQLTWTDCSRETTERDGVDNGRGPCAGSETMHVLARFFSEHQQGHQHNYENLLPIGSTFRSGFLTMASYLAHGVDGSEAMDVFSPKVMVRSPRGRETILETVETFAWVRDPKERWTYEQLFLLRKNMSVLSGFLQEQKEALKEGVEDVEINQLLEIYQSIFFRLVYPLKEINENFSRIKEQIYTGETIDHEAVFEEIREYRENFLQLLTECALGSYGYDGKPRVFEVADEDEEGESVETFRVDVWDRFIELCNTARSCHFQLAGVIDGITDHVVAWQYFLDPKNRMCRLKAGSEEVVLRDYPSYIEHIFGCETESVAGVKRERGGKEKPDLRSFKCAR